MKRILSLLCCAVILFCLTGCQKTEPMEKPLLFYYRNADVSYDADSASIRTETREGKDFKNFEETLLIYFQGPISAEYVSPFPANLLLVSHELYEGTLYLTVSDELAALSGLDLTIACCCITLTCLELTDAVNVNISAENALLGGEKFITLNRDTIMLLDLVQ